MTTSLPPKQFTTVHGRRLAHVEMGSGDPLALVQQYAQWLRTGGVPKLFINADPGSILVGAQREFCRTWPNQQEVTVPGLHFIPEDSGAAIGQAVAAWLSKID